MADSVNMTQFIAEVRRLGEFETLDEENSFATDDEIESRGNRNLRKVFLALVRARGANYFRTFEDKTTTAGSSSVALPTPMMQLLGVSRRVTSSQWETLLDFNDSERDGGDYLADLGFVVGPSMRYQLRGSNLEIVPTPTSVETLRIHYVPGFTPITKAGGETFDGVAGFEEWAIWETVGELLHKDGRDPSFARDKAQWWEREVESMGRQRDASGPRRVSRVRDRRRFGRWP